MTDIIGVTGGAAGVAASYAAARGLADAFDEAGDRLRERAGHAARVMTDPDLLESALLAPGTCAAAEAAVLAATAGPAGLVPVSLGWETSAVAVRSAVAQLEVADEAAGAAVSALDHQLGFLALGVLTSAAGIATVGGLAASGALDPGVLTEQPGLVEHLVNGLGPLASAAGALYGGPGRPVVTSAGGSTTGRQPTSVHDLLEHLQDVAALSPTPDSPGNGTIEVQTVTGADGEVRHIVNLPGTDDFNAPWHQDGDVRDLETGLDAMSGQSDAYQQGILDAMGAAGIGDEPVLIVGHSLGGMEAVAILAGDHGFNVTDVVTAGSPTAQVASYPTGSNVLSLEQHGDLVPLLDGAPNPDTVEQTTVVFDADPEPGVTGHHYYSSYLAGAAAVDGSAHPSVVAAVQSLHDHGFLGDGGEVRSQVFQIVRD